MLRFIKDHNHKGQEAENIALNYLQLQGLTKIQSNFSCKCGEIDLIMQDNEFLVFIEVRYRKKSQFGHPLETIDLKKQQKILQTAQFFLLKNPKYQEFPCRIDAVALSAQKTRQKKTMPQETIEWVKNIIQS